MDMADLKNKLKSHLCSARYWLGKAEESIEKDRDIRAELNLMLAQAEITHAKTVKSEKHCRQINYRGLLIRSILLTGLASFVLVFGFGGFMGIHHKVATESQQATQENVGGLGRQSIVNKQVESAQEAPAMNQSVTINQQPTMPAVEIETKSPQQKVDVEAPTVKLEEMTALPEQPIRLQPHEMQELISAAGKSLRGK